MTPTPKTDEVRRDDRALARVDLFVFAAFATVLLVRTLLAVTGYPQVGGGGLHVAHVLWGGLLMGIALLLVEIFPGSRTRVRAALIGGIGFGLFIDEVGKFVTKDVDYFFKPTFAIIYATLVALYLLARLALHVRPLTDGRRLAVATQSLADLALGQLDAWSREYALLLLEGIDETSQLSDIATKTREVLLADTPTKGFDSRITASIDAVERRVRRLLSWTVVRVVVLCLFGVQAAVVVVNVAVTVVAHGGDGRGRRLLDTGLPATVSGALLVVGVVALIAGRRERALLLLEWSVIVDLLFTQVAVFYREQWVGLAGFAISLGCLGTLQLMRRGPDRSARFR